MSDVEPGEVIIGGATRDLLGDEFELEELSETAIRGLIGTEHSYRVKSVHE